MIFTKKYRRTLLVILGSLLMIGVLAACQNDEDVVAEYPIVLSTKLIDEGRPIYQTNCASCHGDANTPPPLAAAPRHTADGHTWHHRDEQLVGWVLDGVPNGQIMPKFRGTLSELEVQAAIAYIKTFWPNDIIQMQARGEH